MKIKVVLTGNREQSRHYIKQEITRPGSEEKKYRVSDNHMEIANDEERIIFVTPDTIDKIRGMRIDSFDEEGTAYEDNRKDYQYALDVIKASLN